MRSIRFARATAVAATTLGLMFAGTSLASANDSGSGAVTASKPAPASGPAKIAAHQGSASARTAARAAAAPIDIYGVRSSHVAFNSRVEYTATRFSVKRKTTSAYQVTNVLARLYKGSKYIKTTTFGPRTGGTISLGTTYGRGTFRVGGFYIYWRDANGGSHRSYDGSYGYFTGKSALRGGFKHAKVFKIHRSGSRHVVKVNLKRYVKKGKWKGYSKKIKFQHKKHGWHNQKTLKLKKGKKTYTFYTSARRKYRLKVHATSTTSGGKSLWIKI